MNEMRLCLFCDALVEGRRDKKFCSKHCRTAYHNHRRLTQNLSQYRKVDMILKNNRTILKDYHKSGVSYVPVEEVRKEGFDEKYFTHQWTSPHGYDYTFCYEYGYRIQARDKKPRFVFIKQGNQ